MQTRQRPEILPASPTRRCCFSLYTIVRTHAVTGLQRAQLFRIRHTAGFAAGVLMAVSTCAAYAERNYFARVFAHKLRSSRSAPVSKASVLASRVHTLGLQHSMFFTSCCFAHGNIGKARKQRKGQGLGRNERGTTQLVSAAFFYCLRLREEAQQNSGMNAVLRSWCQQLFFAVFNAAYTLKLPQYTTAH